MIWLISALFTLSSPRIIGEDELIEYRGIFLRLALRIPHATYIPGNT